MRELRELHEEWRKHEGDASELYPPLTKAVVEEDFLRLAQLLKGKPDLEYEAITKGNFAFRPIHFAADCGNDAVSAALLTMLLQAGADPNAIARDVRNWRHPRSPTTPLHIGMQHEAPRRCDCASRTWGGREWA